MLVITAGLVGLVISYALTVSSFLNSVVGSLTETERELVSVERFHQYLEGTEPEKREGITTPPFGWPSHGSIKFQNVYLRYQLVLLLFFIFCLTTMYCTVDQLYIENGMGVHMTDKFKGDKS